MILFLIQFISLSFGQVDLSHTKYCHNLTKLVEQLSRAGSNRALLARACGSGDGKAFYELMERNNRLPSIAKTNLAKKGCDRGYTPACVYLSKNLKSSVNPQKTVKDLKGGCVQGNVPACASLGIIQNREGKEKEALKSFNFACESGDGESCYMMGKIYEKQGRMKSAIKMHKYSCDKKGMARSCLVVGKDFQKSKASDKKAIYFYLNKACKGSIEEACFLLEKL